VSFQREHVLEAVQKRLDRNPQAMVRVAESRFSPRGFDTPKTLKRHARLEIFAMQN